MDNDSQNVSAGRSEADSSAEPLALDAAFEQCRNYLAAIADKSLEPPLRAKISTADVLQQTYLEAHRDFGRFRGTTDAQARAWLRRILLNNIANGRRQFNTSKRNIHREQHDIEANAIRTRDKTPSSVVAKDEEMRLLELAMQDIPEDYRKVIRLRNLERRSWHEIATEFERSDEATRKLWFRAMKCLKSELQKHVAQLKQHTNSHDAPRQK